MKTIVEVDNKQYVRDVIVYNSETQEPLVVTDSTPLLYLQRRGFKNIKTKEVPETWEDLIDLCKDLIDVDMTENSIFLVGINFRKNGEVFDNDSITIAENRTPAQMWQIIKNLVEER